MKLQKGSSQPALPRPTEGGWQLFSPDEVDQTEKRGQQSETSVHTASLWEGTPPERDRITGQDTTQPGTFGKEEEESVCGITLLEE